MNKLDTKIYSLLMEKSNRNDAFNKKKILKTKYSKLEEGKRKRNTDLESKI